jgi:hypothetical protein
MRIRALLFTPVLAAAALGIGAGGASAATLFTTTAHSARVTVGATATATSTTPIPLTSGATRINTCTHSQLNLTLTANNDTAGVQANVTGGSFSPCNSPVTGNFATPWKLTISGTATISGGFSRYAAAVDNVSFNLLGGVYAGNLTTGITATQPTAAAAPLCLHMNAAGSVSGPLTGDGRIDGTYCLTNTFSLTN